MSFEKQLFVGSLILVLMIGIAAAVGSGGGPKIIVVVSPAQTHLVQGGIATLTATPGPGAGLPTLTLPPSAFTYQWYNNTNPSDPVAIAGQAGTKPTFTFNNIAHGNTIGIFSFYVVVNGLGYTANSNMASVQVAKPLEITLTAANTYVATGQSVSLTNATLNILGSTTYSYTTSGCGSASVVKNKITLSAPGTCTVTEHVSDSYGSSNSSSVVITVVTPLAFTSFTSNVVQTGPGGSVLFTNTTSGGTGSNIYSYSVRGLSGGYSENGNVFTFTKVGSYLVTENALDLSGEVAQSQSISILVAGSLNAEISPANVIVTIGSPVTLNAVIYSNDYLPPNYDYSWTNSSGTICPDTPTCTFNAPGGTEEVVLRVTDNNDNLGATTTATVNTTAPSNSATGYIPISNVITLYLGLPSNVMTGNNAGITATAEMVQSVPGGIVGLALGGYTPTPGSWTSTGPIYMGADQSYTFDPTNEGSFDPSNTYVVNTFSISSSPWATGGVSIDGNPSTPVNITGSNDFNDNFEVQLADIGFYPTENATLGAAFYIYHNGVEITGPDQCYNCGFFQIGTPQTLTTSDGNSITINVNEIASASAQVQLFLLPQGSSPSAKLVNTGALETSGPSASVTCKVTVVNGIKTRTCTTG